MEETKVCTKCGKELPLDAYYKGGDKYGLDYICKECRKAQSKYRSAKMRGRSEEPKPQVAEHHLHKVYTNKDLAIFTARDLMLELNARGYKGELVFEEVIVHRVNISKL